jgi:hypothetical protein
MSLGASRCMVCNPAPYVFIGADLNFLVRTPLSIRLSHLGLVTTVTTYTVSMPPSSLCATIPVATLRFSPYWYCLGTRMESGTTLRGRLDIIS